MGTTAKKLTYLNETKTQLKDTINYSGASITDETFRQYPRKLYAQYLDILKDTSTLFNGMPKVPQQTGTELTINNTANTKMKLELNPSELTQETTTQSSNLFDESKYENATYTTGVYKYTPIDIKGNRTLYFKSSLKSGKTEISGLYIGISDNGSNPNQGTRMWAVRNGESATQEYYSRDFTGINDLYLAYYPTSVNVEDIFDTYNLWVSTTDTSYVPFVPNRPSPDYPSDVQVIKDNNSIKIENRNLWDEQWELGGYNTTTGVKDSSQDKIRNKNPISCKPNTQYYVCINNSESTNTIRLLYYDKNMNFLSTVAGNRNTIVTTPSNTYYINFMCTTGYGTTYKNDICINYSDVSFNGQYVAHQEQILPLNMTRTGKNMFNVYQFEQELVSGKILNDNGEEINDSSSTYSKYKIPVIANQSYNIKGWFQRVYYYNANGEFTSRTSATNNLRDYTYTPTADGYIGFQISNTLWSSNKGQEQVELGNTATSYEPYTTLEYCKIGTYEDDFIKTSGKNRFNFNNSIKTSGNVDLSNYGVTYNINEQVLNINGTMSGTNTFILSDLDINSGNYTISIDVLGGTINNPVYVTLLDENGTTITTMDLQNTSLASQINVSSKLKKIAVYISNGRVFSNYKIRIQLEAGSTATSYEPYGTGDWWLKKAIGKVVLDGSENYTDWGTSPNWNGAYIINPVQYNASSGSDIRGKSDYFPVIVGTGSAATNGCIGFRQSDNQKIWYFILKYDFNNLVEFKSWLSTHNTTVYYILATPTHTEITDTTLISQLNAIEQAVSYDEQTNISQTNTGLPFRIKASAIKNLESIFN